VGKQKGNWFTGGQRLWYRKSGTAGRKWGLWGWNAEDL